MTNSLPKEKEGAFVLLSLSQKYGTLRKTTEMPSRINNNNERETKSLARHPRQYYALPLADTGVRKVVGGTVVARRIETLLKELPNLTDKIQEKTAENSKITTTSRLKLVTFEQKPALTSLTPQIYQYVGDVVDQTTKSIRGILKDLDKLLESVSDNNDYKTKEARLNDLEKQFKLATTKEKSLNIIRKLAREGYCAAPILRRLIERTDDPDIYQEAANILIYVLK